MRSVRSAARSTTCAALGLLGIAAVAAGCSRPLPDADTPGARAYAAQCGLCHTAYAPSLLTAAMWDIQVARMDELRARRGVPPLDAADRTLILDYLRSHAG